MLFNSVHYFIFAPVVIVLYFMLEHRGKRWLLLFASLYFYAVFRVSFIAVLLASVLVTYFFVRLLDRSNDPFRRKVYLWSAIGGNLLLLFVFKYLDFAIRSVNLFLGFEPCDSSYMGPVGIILPLGISFFTLQAISYAVDVYRRTITATRNPFDFTLFLTFFPQLVAGPIMRAQDIIHQFNEKHRFDSDALRSGLLLIAMGLFKKTLVGDGAGIVVDEVFAKPENYDWISMWSAVFLHTVQIYGDFSGYSDIAIGTGRIMGFRIPLNFNRPLLALSVTDIWRRWHISLSTFLRDYIYIPLGGSRVSVSRAYINLFITWVVTGLWHGADWTFVLWGITHALFLVFERIVLRREPIKGYFESLPSFLRIFYTLWVFSFALFFFRAHPTGMFAEGVETAFYMIGRAFTFASGQSGLPGFSVLIPMIIMFFIEIMRERKEDFFETYLKNNWIAYTIVGTIFSLSFIIYAVSASPQFIYFQF